MTAEINLHTLLISSETSYPVAHFLMYINWHVSMFNSCGCRANFIVSVITYPALLRNWKTFPWKFFEYAYLVGIIILLNWHFHWKFLEWHPTWKTVLTLCWYSSLYCNYQESLFRTRKLWRFANILEALCHCLTCRRVYLQNKVTRVSVSRITIF